MDDHRELLWYPFPFYPVDASNKDPVVRLSVGIFFFWRGGVDLVSLKSTQFVYNVSVIFKIEGSKRWKKEKDGGWVV